MNKLLVTISLVLFTTFSFAQTITYGIKAGANLSTVAFSGSLPDFAINNQNKTGYQIGATVDIGFQHFSIQPGLFYITKGEKYVTEGTYQDQNNQTTGQHVNGNTRYNYLELPVNLLYKLQVSPTVKIYAGGGPYLGYGISGTTNASFTTGTNSSTNQFGVSFGSGGYKDNKLLDYGINFAEGVEINKHYTIDMNYSLGLRNISHDIGDVQFRNRTLGLSVGYLF
jgi:Outer membrane protein beta-barrel domain